MNIINEEYKNNDNKEINKNNNNLIQNEIKNTDIEELSNKSHKLQRPIEILSKYDKSYNINIFKGNDSRLSLETFKTMFKNKNKELKEYKDSLDRKIEILRNKINAKNLQKGRNKKFNDNSSIEKYENTLNDNDNDINTSSNNKNYKDSLLFTLKGGSHSNKNGRNNDNIGNNISFGASIIFNLKFNYDKFMDTFFNSKENNKYLFILLSFLNSNDLFKFFSINKSIRNGIIDFLKNETKKKIIPKFYKKYCNNILFNNNNCDFRIIRKQYKKNKKAFIRIILSIKANISKNNLEIINKKHQILFQTLKPKNLDKSTFTSYSFEIIPKFIPKRFWIYKEYTSFHYDDHDKAYYNDLIQFWPGDQILISIGLISEIGIIDFNNFHWLNPRIVPKIKMDNISKLPSESYLTNSENTCEVEELVNGWLGIEQLDNYKSVMKTLDDLFGNYFSINEIYFEDVGYYFFKVILQAKNEGECNGINNNLGINIKIYPKDKPITNEIKKNGLIYDENNELTVNIDDIITFYISQNK